MTDDKIKKQAIEINMLYKVNEEQEIEINRLKMIIDLKDDERIELVKENTTLKNDYKQAVNEVKLLNNQIDNLITENNQLKFRNKMLTKIGLNSIYGIHCCKNHCVYTDTDSINTESEDKE